MARPFKSGIDYFPLDTIPDDKIEILEAEHGIVGFGVLVKIYQKIYANNYWIKWDKKSKIVFSNRINVNINEVNDVINSCFEWDIMNKNLLEKYGILTSRGIQKRFFEIVKRRKKIEVTKEFLLIDIRSYFTEKEESLRIINVSINKDIVNTSTQRKGKERKGENKKTYVEDSDEFRLAKLLSDLILENNPNNKSSISAKKDNYQKWSDTIRLANQEDGRSFQQIEYLINWSQKDDWWFKTIHSPSSLRKNFDKMADSVKEKKNNSKSVSKPNFNNQPSFQNNPSIKQMAKEASEAAQSNSIIDVNQQQKVINAN